MKQLNEIQLVYTRSPTRDIKISSSDDVYKLSLNIYNQSNCLLDLKEYFFIILLDRANHILGYYKLSEGGISGTVADIKLIFATALKTASSAIVLVHNHPSGSLKPSKADIALTQKVKQAGNLLEIAVLDHLIISSTDYYSFTDNSL